MTQVKWTEQKISELIDLARAGEPWEAITAYFYPGMKRGVTAAIRVFDRHASEADKVARKQALADRNYNYPKGRGGSQEKPEPAMRREMRSPWAGMGNCFA